MKALFLLLITVSLSPAATYFLTVAGLGGTPEYETQFSKWAGELSREISQNGPDAHVTTLCGATATRENVRAALAKLAADMKPEDAFALFLIGHGTFDGTDYKFNLPGPDITATGLKALLSDIPARRQLIVNMTSCSGASFDSLVRKDRIVITATKSGTEKNATVFARYWVDALSDPAADTDKNGTVSALEAYRYAETKTTGYFESQKLLATEHSLFSDTGSEKGVREPKPDNQQGLLAAAFPLLHAAEDTTRDATRNAGPQKQKLIARKEELEAKIDRLKYQKAAMPPDEYKQQLTALLLELARTQAQIDQ